MGEMAIKSRGTVVRTRGRKLEAAHIWAKWLHNPCLPGGVRGSASGGNQKWPGFGQNGYVTPAFSGVPGAQHKDIKRGPSMGKMVTSPLPSSDKIRSAYLTLAA